MNKKCILIYASELAACIGKNPYKNKLEAIKVTYCRNNDKPIDDEVAPILKKIDEKILCKSEIDDDTDKIIDNINNNKNIIDKLDLSQDEKDILFDHVKNVNRREHGVHQEAKINADYSKKNNVVIKKDNVFRKKLLYEDDEHQVFIGGKCDGIMRDSCLVEIKTRMYKLFEQVREYEKIQMFAYCYIYNISKVQLIEQYKDESMTHEIIFDEDYFDSEIKQAIIDFLQIYREL